jgi:hypothetical protein
MSWSRDLDSFAVKNWTYGLDQRSASLLCNTDNGIAA